MKVLLTGAGGAVGKPLAARLRQQYEVLTLEKDDDTAQLERSCALCNVVFHMADFIGHDAETVADNVGLTQRLLDMLEKQENPSPIVMLSSVQAEQNTPYGQSKWQSEQLLMHYVEAVGTRAIIYRLPMLLGSGVRPTDNPASALCYHIAHGLPISHQEIPTNLQLVCAEDVVDELMLNMSGKEHRNGLYGIVPTVYAVTAEQLTEKLLEFYHNRDKREIPDMSNPFVRRLYNSYLSYLPKDNLSRALMAERTESGFDLPFIRTADRGAVAVKLVKIGAKRENCLSPYARKLLVAGGTGVICLHPPDDSAPLYFPVSSEHPEILDIPMGTACDIENQGNSNLVAVVWTDRC